MLPLKPPYNILHFINILLSPNIYTFWDMKIILHPHPIFSALPNLNFLTSETQKFKFDKLPPTQNEPKDPKRSQINPHLDHETSVHILLEDAAYRCFDLARTDLAPLSPNRATHLKSPEKNIGGLWQIWRIWRGFSRQLVLAVFNSLIWWNNSINVCKNSSWRACGDLNFYVWVIIIAARNKYAKNIKTPNVTFSFVNLHNFCDL